MSNDCKTKKGHMIGLNLTILCLLLNTACCRGNIFGHFLNSFILLNHDLWFCVSLYIHTVRYSAETFVHLGMGKNNQVRNMKGLLCDFVWTENL